MRQDVLFGKCALCQYHCPASLPAAVTGRAKEDRNVMKNCEEAPFQLFTTLKECSVGFLGSGENVSECCCFNWSCTSRKKLINFDWNSSISQNKTTMIGISQCGDKLIKEYELWMANYSSQRQRSCECVKHLQAFSMHFVNTFVVFRKDGSWGD